MGVGDRFLVVKRNRVRTGVRPFSWIPSSFQVATVERRSEGKGFSLVSWFFRRSSVRLVVMELTRFV